MSDTYAAAGAPRSEVDRSPVDERLVRRDADQYAITWRRRVLANVAACITPTVADVHREIAASEVPAPERSDAAITLLAEAVQKQVALLYHAVGMHERWGEVAAVDKLDNALLIDVLAAQHLNKIGQRGAQLGEELLTNARTRWSEFCGAQLAIGSSADAARDGLWRVWAGAPPSIMRAIADALWTDEIAARAALMRRRQPALALAVLDRADAALWVPRREFVELPTGQRCLMIGGYALADWRGAPVGDPDLADYLPSDSSSLTAIRLVPYLVEQAYRQRYTGIPRYDVLTIVGGYQALATALRLHSKKAAEEVRRALFALRDIHVRWPHREIAGLLIFDHVDAAGQRPAALKIKLADVLLPEFVVTLGKGRGVEARRGRQLVPLPALPLRFCGDRRTHASQARLLFRLMETFRLHAQEVARDGYIHVGAHERRELADRVQLPPSKIGQVLDHFSHEGLIVCRSPDLVGLGPKHAGQHNSIVDAAKKEIAGAKAQARHRRRTR